MLRLCSLIATAVLAGAAAFAAPRTLMVSAPHRDYHDALCSIALDAPASAQSAVLRLGKQNVPVQVRRDGGKLQLTWMIHELAKGGTQTYTVAFSKKPAPPSQDGVRIENKGGDLEIYVNGALFTRYNVNSPIAKKPFFWPIYGPDSKLMVRSYPLAKVEGETTDHPHHKGMWFDHGSVNGTDYWDEGPKCTFTKNTGFQEVTSGPVYGVIRASTDWVDLAGKKQLEDTRKYTVFATTNAIVMDFEVVTKASNGPVVWGDTKEGAFGIRIPDSMRTKGGDGHMLSSTGLKDEEVWGSRAEWVDYYGTVQGATMGIAILDNPGNLRHPTYWHARYYGLFAVNPFGIHEFDPSQKDNKTAGDFTMAPGSSQAFRYRVIFHRGDATTAGIGDAWGAYTDPPLVAVK